MLQSTILACYFCYSILSGYPDRPYFHQLATMNSNYTCAHILDSSMYRRSSVLHPVRATAQYDSSCVGVCTQDIPHPLRHRLQWSAVVRCVRVDVAGSRKASGSPQMQSLQLDQSEPQVALRAIESNRTRRPRVAWKMR